MEDWGKVDKPREKETHGKENLRLESGTKQMRMSQGGDTVPVRLSEWRGDLLRTPVASRMEGPACQVILSQGNQVSRSSKLKLLVTSLGNYQYTESSVLKGNSQACGMPLN